MSHRISNVKVLRSWRQSGVIVLGDTPPRPTITGISPDQLLPAGGTITITGTGFTGATGGTANGAALTGFTVNSDTQITATVPSGAAGTVTVTVNSPYGNVSDSSYLVRWDLTQLSVQPTLYWKPNYDRAAMPGVATFGSVAATLQYIGNGPVNGATVDGYVPMEMGIVLGTPYAGIQTTAPLNNLNDFFNAGTTEGTIIAMFKAKSVSAAAAFYYDDSYIGGCVNGAIVALVVNGSGVRAGMSDGTPKNTGHVAYTAGNWAVACATYTDRVATVWCNGTSGTPSDALPGVGTTPFNTTGIQFASASGWTGGGSAPELYLMEFMMFDFRIGDEERGRVYTYLRQKYPTAALPVV